MKGGKGLGLGQFQGKKIGSCQSYYINVIGFMMLSPFFGGKIAVNSNISGDISNHHFFHSALDKFV